MTSNVIKLCHHYHLLMLFRGARRPPEVLGDDYYMSIRRGGSFRWTWDLTRWDWYNALPRRLCITSAVQGGTGQMTAHNRACSGAQVEVLMWGMPARVVPLWRCPPLDYWRTYGNGCRLTDKHLAVKFYPWDVSFLDGIRCLQLSTAT